MTSLVSIWKGCRFIFAKNITILYISIVKKQDKIEPDFIVDKLTNSIENVQSGDRFPTEISLLTKADIKSIIIKKGWRFNWNNEMKQPERDVFKLTIVNNPTIFKDLLAWK